MLLLPTLICKVYPSHSTDGLPTISLLPPTWYPSKVYLVPSPWPGYHLRAWQQFRYEEIGLDYAGSHSPIAVFPALPLAWYVPLTLPSLQQVPFLPGYQGIGNSRENETYYRRDTAVPHRPGHSDEASHSQANVVYCGVPLVLRVGHLFTSAVWTSLPLVRLSVLQPWEPLPLIRLLSWSWKPE
jgi:hypothetical protein